ncbi:MAG: TIGR04552 family protein [Pseudomonadota bacterium]|nr:TIGR04552 family protein [Pseudomonadota bacterium]
MSSSKYDFPRQAFDVVLGGISAIDIPRLNIHTLEEANEFIRTYGYNWDEDKDREQIWSFHRQAVTMLKDVFKVNAKDLPEVLLDPNRLGHIGYLLIYSSTMSEGDNVFQKWSCAILRIMHVLVHLKNDLSSHFIEQMQLQILRPFKERLVEISGVGGVTLGREADKDQIKLVRFDVKPLKTSTSAVVKLLAKREYVAPFIMDRVGIRFVTKGIFDSFRVVRFLIEEHLVSFPNNVITEARNTVYPVNLFFEYLDEVKKSGRDLNSDSVDKDLHEKLENEMTRAEYKERENIFSGENYRAIKFINRRRITIENILEKAQRHLSFYYPYEVQIMSQETYLQTLSGPSAHDKYKERQIAAARSRVLGGI